MDLIEPKMNVAEVVDRYPETVEVFLRHDCPDMRRGLFRIMSRIMSVRAAAWIHGIPLEELMQELNEVAKQGGAAAGPKER